MAGISRTISVKQWSKELRAIWGRGLATGFTKVAEAGLLEAAMRIRPILQARSDQLAHDIGAYKRGWESQVRGLRLTIFNTAPYSGVIEEGRRPGSRMPPADALIPWIKRKLLPSAPVFGPKQRRGMTKGRRVELALAETERVENIAWMVARAIARRGIPGKHVIGGIMDEIEKIVVEEVADALRKKLEGDSEGDHDE